MNEADIVVEVVEKAEVTPVPVIEPQPEAQPTEPKVKQEEPATEADEAHDKPNRVQKRIDKLTRKYYEEKSRADALERIYGTPQAPQPTDNSPQRNQFATDAEYLSAAVQHEVKKQVSSLQPVQAQPESTVEDPSKHYADYEDVIDDAEDMIIPNHAADVIRQSPYMKHLAYTLAKEPAKLEALKRMSPALAIKEIGRMELTIERDIETKQKQQPKKVSSAPAPITPVTPLGGAEVDEGKLSDQEWWARDRKRALQKKG